MRKIKSISSIIHFSFILIYAISILTPASAVFADDGTTPVDEIIVDSEVSGETQVIETPEVTPTPDSEDTLPEENEVVLPAETNEPVEDIDLAEIVDLLESEDMKIEDANGQPLSLASTEAAEVLADSDPFFWNGTNWVGYTVSGTGCPANVTCMADPHPFQAAASAAPANTTIYVATGTYNEDVIINTANLSFVAFNSVNVDANDLFTTPTVTNPGYATVNKLTLNANFGTTTGVYANDVVVNTGGFLNDALNLINPTEVEATIEANLVLYGSGDYYRIRDANDASTNFEWDCGEPQIFISPGINYRMLLKNPYSADVVQYYVNNPDERPVSPTLAEKLSAEERIEDLILAANMSEQTVGSFTPWSNANEQIVYWNMLGHVNGVSNLTTQQKAYADYITMGTNDDTISLDHRLWFLWPLGTTNASGVTTFDKSPLNTQFTFLKYIEPEVNGCTDPENCNNCPWGEELIDQVGCVPIVCEFGEQINADGVGCEPIICPVGQQLNDAGNGCEPIICEVGTELVGNECEPIVCPVGERLVGNDCEPIICEVGTELVGNNCEPIVCPADEKLVGNDCKPKTDDPGDPAPGNDGVIPVTGGTIIASGLGHSCMTTSDNRVLCWGLNSSGQVGDETNVNRQTAVFVKDLDGVYNLTLGSRHSCALTSDGEIWCWGENSSGQLGNGSTTNSNVPVLVTGLPGKAIKFDAGENFTCAVLEDNSIWCWGENSSGQLNDGTKNNQPSPVQTAFTSLPSQISGGQSELVGEAAGLVSLWGNLEPQNISGISGAMNISGNRWATGGCAATAGNLVNCWGADNQPKPVEGTSEVLFVDAGWTHNCAMDINNNVLCWGDNANGELGDGKTESREAGARVSNLGSVVALAVGGNHTCVLVGGSTAMCWGSNIYGQLGNDTTTNSSIPVYVILPLNLDN